MRGVNSIILILLFCASTAWGAVKFELTGGRPPVSSLGIASINREGVVFKTNLGEAGFKRYRWSDFSKKGLETLLSQLPAERAFLQKNAQTRLLFLDFIRTEILAKTPRPAAAPVEVPAAAPVEVPAAGPVEVPAAGPVVSPIEPVNPAREKLAVVPLQIQRFHAKAVSEDNGKKDEFNLVPGPAIPPPPANRLSPNNWLNPGSLLVLLILSGLSAYSGYEIAGFRHRPVKVVCALSALCPVIVPLVVLLLPDPAEAHAQAVAEANDRFLLPPAAAAGAVEDNYDITAEETHIEGIDGAVVMERYLQTENHFSDRFFSDYFGRFYQASPPSGQTLVVQTSEVIYPVHHISNLEPESLSVVYAQGQEWVEEVIDYRLIEEVRVEASTS